MPNYFKVKKDDKVIVKIIMDGTEAYFKDNPGSYGWTCWEKGKWIEAIDVAYKNNHYRTLNFEPYRIGQDRTEGDVDLDGEPYGIPFHVPSYDEIQRSIYMGDEKTAKHVRKTLDALYESDDFDLKMRGLFDKAHKEIRKHGKEKGVSIWLKKHGAEFLGKIADAVNQFLKSIFGYSRGQMQRYEAVKTGFYVAKEAVAVDKVKSKPKLK